MAYLVELYNPRSNEINPIGELLIFVSIKFLETHNSKNEIKKIQDENCHCTWECFQRMNVVHSPKIYPKIVTNLIKRL